MAVDGGGLEEVADAQGVELEGVRIHKSRGVALVDGQSHGLAGLAQHGGHVLIGGGDAAAHVRHHNDGVRQLDADLRLAAHKFQHIAVGARFNAAGIHQGEGSAAPLAGAVDPVRLPIDPVPGDAGGVLHDGGALTGELIKQHGFANVGAAYNGHQWLCHENTSFLFQRLSLL